MSDYYLDVISRCADMPLFNQRPPAQRHSVTSMQAADSLDAPTLSRLERVVFQWLAKHGPATDEEIIAGTGLNPSTARPRRVALVRRGMVIEAGTRKTASRRSATVWRVA